MKTVLIKLGKPLGDTLAIMPYCNKYTIESSDDVYVHLLNSKNIQLFKNTYPSIKFVTHEIEADDVIDVRGIGQYSCSLQQGLAAKLGYNNAKYIRPKCDSFKKDRPIRGKYVVIAMQSTAQLKYWNHINGKRVQLNSPNWNELCKKLRKNGLTPVIIDWNESFGKAPFWNNIPNKAVNKTKLSSSLVNVANYIEHAEFFIGLSSGLSWFAHALGQKVVMISNFTEDWHEFDLNCSDYIRITNKKVCHGCWTNGKYTFNPNDWYWCPLHKDTSRQFECHTSITPEMVFEKIKKWL